MRVVEPTSPVPHHRHDRKSPFRHIVRLGKKRNGEVVVKKKKLLSPKSKKSSSSSSSTSSSSSSFLEEASASHSTICTEISFLTSSFSEADDVTVNVVVDDTGDDERRVRFALQQTVVHEYQEVPYEDHHRVYMSSDELQQEKDDAAEAAKAFARNNRECVERLELLLDSPFQKRTKNNKNRKAEEGEEDKDGGSDVPDEGLFSMSDFEAIQVLCKSEGLRGLEHRVSALMRRHQRHVNESVLSRHRSLKAEDKPCSDMILRSRCQLVNKTTKELAIKMAQGDAVEAKRIYDEDQHRLAVPSSSDPRNL